MDGNPEGTPNPLNPMPGTASAANSQQPDRGMATGTGMPSNFGEAAARPASFAQTTESAMPTGSAIPTESAMPEMPKPAPTSAMPEMQTAPRPVPRPGGNVVDPMMRPVAHRNINETMPEPEMNPDPLDTFSDDFVAKDSVVEPTAGKSKKKPLIIGAIILIFVAVICATAAVALMLVNNNSGDRVGKAIEKMLSGDAPTIIGAKGTISTAADTTGTTVKFDGTFDLKNSTNQVQASVDMDFGTGSTISVDIDETQVDGNTFFRLSGLSSSLDALKVSATEDETNTNGTNTEGEANTETNCADAPCNDGEECTNSCSSPSGTTATGTLGMLIATYSNLIETVDGEWILISDDFGNSMNELSVFDNTSTCLINAFGTLPQYAKDIVGKYKANPFITYSTGNLGISKKKNELYKLGIDENKLTAFTNSLSNNGFVNELNACAGNDATNSDVSSNLIVEIFNNFPTMYAEVDENNNFTRFYFKATTSDNETTADIDLTYPKTFTPEEPETYISMSDLLTEVMSTLVTNGSLIEE